MASLAFQKLLVIALLAVRHAAAQDTSPGAPTLPGIAKNCNSWHTVAADDSCYRIETDNGISHEDFIKWNPDVSDDCLTNYWGGYAYCVGVGADTGTSSKSTSSEGSTSSKPTSTEGSTSSGISITSSQSGITTSRNISTSTVIANSTYSVREPITTWNLTTTTVETTYPPQKTQAGQPSYCDNWYYVDIGDTCDIIVGTSSLITMEELSVLPYYLNLNQAVANIKCCTAWSGTQRYMTTVRDCTTAGGCALASKSKQ